MIKKIITVTFAVCAYNEEKNILHHLKSVLKQKEIGYKLNKILVVSDGSKDETVKLVRSLRSKRIEIWDDKKRIGKSSRLNDIYRSLKTDILVQSDADVILSSPNIIRHMIEPLIHNKNTMMTGGNPMPLNSETFTEEAINKTTQIYHKLRHIVRSGNNIFSVDGRILAYKSKFISKVIIPTTMIANDAFTYFTCITQGYDYVFASRAVVKYRSPQTLKDQIRQNTRFVSAPARFKRYFSKDLVNQEYFVEPKLLWSLRFNEFIKYPVHCLYIFTINLYCKLRSKFLEPTLNARWSMAETSKELEK